MAGIQLQVSVDDAEVRALFQRIQSKLGDLSPAMKIIGEIVTRSVKENFRQGGRPTAWTPLSAATLKNRGANKHILVKSGVLRDSIHPTASSKSVDVGTNVIYAAIHHFGGTISRAMSSVTIPARPYLLVQNEDWSAISEALEDYLDVK